MATRITGFIGVSTGNMRVQLRGVLRAQEDLLRKFAASPDADDDDRRLAQSEFERLRKIREVL
jgi:predicted aminopeptidase